MRQRIHTPSTRVWPCTHSQSVSTALPLPLALLAIQSLHTVCPVRDWYVLTGHTSHCTVCVASEYVPASQFRQAALEVSFLYLPSTQATQTSPLRWNPGSHRQASMELPPPTLLSGHEAHTDAPSPLMVPDAQISHGSEPGLDLNVPAWHIVQAPLVPV